MEAAVRVRAIQYETLPRHVADEIGLCTGDVMSHFGALTDLAVLMCVDRYGQKLTAVGDPDDLRQMLEDEGLRRRDDLVLMRSRWPVLLRGWLQPLAGTSIAEAVPGARGAERLIPGRALVSAEGEQR